MDIRGQGFDTTILRRDHNERPAQRLPEPCNEQSPGASGESRHHHVGIPAKRIRSDSAKIRNAGNAPKDLMNSFFEYFHIA